MTEDTLTSMNQKTEEKSYYNETTILKQWCGLEVIIAMKMSVSVILLSAKPLQFSSPLQSQYGDFMLPDGQ